MCILKPIISIYYIYLLLSPLNRGCAAYALPSSLTGLRGLTALQNNIFMKEIRKDNRQRRLKWKIKSECIDFYLLR